MPFSRLFQSNLRRQSQQLSSALLSTGYFESHCCKQCGLISDCFSWNSLIRVHTVCLYAKLCRFSWRLQGLCHEDFLCKKNLYRNLYLIKSRLNTLPAQNILLDFGPSSWESPDLILESTASTSHCTVHPFCVTPQTYHYCKTLSLDVFWHFNKLTNFICITVHCSNAISHIRFVFVHTALKNMIL